MPNPPLQAQSSSPVTVLAQEQSGAGSVGRTYQVAGQHVVTDLRTPWFEKLQVDVGPTTIATDLRLRSNANEDAYRIVFEGMDAIGPLPVEVSCRTDGAAYYLSLGGIGEFTVTPGGDAVICLRREPNTAPDDLVLASMGAPFLIACALRNTWALHASAVASHYGVAAFAGESGFGKSTLARYLATVEDDAFMLVSDDVLPVTLDAGRPFAHADYPQFKLPAGQQPSAGMSETALPLRALFILAQPAFDAGDVAVTRLRAGESALGIASHTVASRLFGRSLLARHLRFCTEAADRLAVYRLSYPRRLDTLPAVREAIDSVLNLA